MNEQPSVGTKSFKFNFLVYFAYNICSNIVHTHTYLNMDAVSSHTYLTYPSSSS
jgi:hypothetical protein